MLKLLFIYNTSTPNGGRTRTTIPGKGILSPSCIPISPSEHLGITKGGATGVCT